ncbi:hypothetical protein SDRG_01100 [Saprolegnia diclina VS20]|uniref:Polycystin domain-containing protein n=1 Tax=Saprolegnia diclina (strain VS20) TaxID=1156394 RepID=T0R2D7_SAPDV|nr:hypothetical protein SDRG_01100 [Saprolegnia diclina VS20]EQC41121.1 hypothetical protein SDRG_01100 [Saprolegnia diclina VS20]|eukprot:XP_008604835.1 hypothetical protein SDRG_01100 [Saprolegnia diclina VS20]
MPRWARPPPERAQLLPDPKKSDAPTPDDVIAELDQVELQLVQVLQENGVGEICRTIKREMDTIWAVQTGFKTLASAGHFYFSCGEQIFTVTPSDGFYDADGLVLALFALRKFPHQPELLCPVLDAINIYAKLDVERALTFCAVDDGTQLLLDCIRNHGDKPDVIAHALNALGSLMLNDDIRIAIATTVLVEELLDLLSRYKASLSLARAFLYPLSNLVVLRELGQDFVSRNGIPTVLHALQIHKDDAQTAWYALALLNALATDSHHTTIMASVHDRRGVRLIARAIAKHIDVEEIVLEGLQLLECIANVPDCYRVINENHVLDLAYRAVALYKGPAYAHTRLELTGRITTFQKCAIQDGHIYALHEGVTHGDAVFYSVFLLLIAIYAAVSPYSLATNTAPLVNRLRVPPLLSSIPELYGYLNSAPFTSSLFPTTWYNGDPLDNPRIVFGSQLLIGDVQARQVRATSNRTVSTYSLATVTSAPKFGAWSDGAASQSVDMTLHGYAIPAGGFLSTLPTDAALAPQCSSAKCVLSQWQLTQWLDADTRALVLEWNLYNTADDACVAFSLSFVVDVASGGIYSEISAQSVLFSPYHGVFLFAGLFYLEVALILCTLSILYDLIAKVRRYRQYYFYIPSHVLDAVLVVLWLAMWASRIQFLAMTTYSLSVQLAGPSFVSLQNVIAVAKLERVLFGCISLLMWLNYPRYLAFKKLRYLLCVLDASLAMIASYALYMAVVVVGLAQFRFLSTTSASLWTNVVGVFHDVVSQDATHAILSLGAEWPSVLYLVSINSVVVPFATMVLAPHLQAGYAVSSREPDKPIEPPKRTETKSKPSFKRTMTTFTRDLKIMLEQRQRTIRKHAFAPWEQSDASWSERAIHVDAAKPSTAPALLAKLRRLVTTADADATALHNGVAGLLLRLEEAHHLLRAQYGLRDKPRTQTQPRMLRQLKTPPESYVHRRQSSIKDKREASL